MTSVIKVDNIQKADGNSASVADLGVSVPTSSLPAGTMIKTHTLKSPSNSQLALTNSSFADMDAFTITTQANSTLIWVIDTQQYTKSGGNVNVMFRLLIILIALSFYNPALSSSKNKIINKMKLTNNIQKLGFFQR